MMFFFVSSSHLLEQIRDLLDCILHNRTCQLFQSVSPKLVRPQEESESNALYVSVPGNGKRQVLVSYLQRILFKQTGVVEETALNDTACYALREQDTRFEYYWMLGPQLTGECVKSVTYTTRAMSPAFSDDSTEKDWAAKEYSSWTESVWSSPEIKIFLKPSPTTEWLLIVMGALVTVISFFIIYNIDKNSKKWFNSRPPSSRTSFDRTAIVTASNDVNT